MDIDCRSIIGSPMLWRISHRADTKARILADRHYNRQKIGANQFVPTGSCLVLYTKTNTGEAFWVTSAPIAQWVRHQWAGAWICSAFRNEGAEKASILIEQAIAATISYYGPPPDLGFVTFVNESKVRPTIVRGKSVWGWTFRKVGFEECGRTKSGLLALQLRPERMPAPTPAIVDQCDLFGYQPQVRMSSFAEVA